MVNIVDHIIFSNLKTLTKAITNQKVSSVFNPLMIFEMLSGKIVHCSFYIDISMNRSKRSKK